MRQSQPQYKLPQFKKNFNVGSHLNIGSLAVNGERRRQVVECDEQVQVLLSLNKLKLVDVSFN